MYHSFLTGLSPSARYSLTMMFRLVMFRVVELVIVMLGGQGDFPSDVVKATLT